ncbi:MAG: GyrI-like domain-containing protein [Bacteroidota bacterium]
MEKTEIKSFDVVGIKIRTANDGSAATDLPKLWGRFMEANLKEKIPNKADDSIYFLYSNYEGDHTQPYDAIIGCKVSSLDKIPDGMISHHVEAGNMAKFVAKGSLIKGEAIINKWFEIWKSGADRSFTTDFEVYDERSKDIQNAEVDIFISLN